MKISYVFPPIAHVYIKAQYIFKNDLTDSEKELVVSLIDKFCDEKFSVEIQQNSKFMVSSYPISTKPNHLSTVEIYKFGYLELDILIHEHGKKFDIVDIRKPDSRKAMPVKVDEVSSVSADSADSDEDLLQLPPKELLQVFLDLIWNGESVYLNKIKRSQRREPVPYLNEMYHLGGSNSSSTSQFII